MRAKLFLFLAVALLTLSLTPMAVVGQAALGASQSTMPWANPANIAFDDHTGSLLVTNHASLVPYDGSLTLLLTWNGADSQEAALFRRSVGRLHAVTSS